jgi:hypothetical protein
VRGTRWDNLFPSKKCKSLRIGIISHLKDGVRKCVYAPTEIVKANKPHKLKNGSKTIKAL